MGLIKAGFLLLAFAGFLDMVLGIIEMVLGIIEMITEMKKNGKN